MDAHSGPASLPAAGRPGTSAGPRDEVIFFALVTACCVGLGGVILWSNGSLMSTGAFLGVAVVALLTIYRVDIGFLMLMGASILFGQFEVPGFNTLTFRISYFKNLKEIPYLPYFSMGNANPFELHFAYVIVVWLALLCIRKDVRVPWPSGSRPASGSPGSSAHLLTACPAAATSCPGCGNRGR